MSRLTGNKYLLCSIEEWAKEWRSFKSVDGHRISMLRQIQDFRSSKVESAFKFQRADSYSRSVKVEIYLQAISSLLRIRDKNEAP